MNTPLLPSGSPSDSAPRSARPGVARPTSTNRLLAQLHPRVWAALGPRLERVTLSLDELVMEAAIPIRWIYFPESAVLSLRAVMADQIVAETGTVGREGMIGLPVLLGADSSPFRCLTQVPGTAQRVRASVLRTLLREHAPLRSLLFRYAHAYLCHCAQMIACNAVHSLAGRCASRLLLTHDRVPHFHPVHGAGFALTQQALATMLGVRREGVSGAARALQRAGLIRFARGRVTVLNRPGLEAATCQCYATVQAHYDELQR